MHSNEFNEKRYRHTLQKTQGREEPGMYIPAYRQWLKRWGISGGSQIPFLGIFLRGDLFITDPFLKMNFMYIAPQNQNKMLDLIVH